MKRIVIISGCILYIYLACANEKNYFFQKVSPESGFAFDAINTITEDCNGFIWFGNNNGLYYYNTSVIEKISLVPPHSNTPQSFAIHKVYLDNNCQLWVCSEFGLYRFESSDNQFKRIVLLYPDTSSEIKPDVTDILQFNDNQFVISASGALYTFLDADSTLKEVTIGPLYRQEPYFVLGEG
jgi:ligand-binding sensor domain-containing protein